MDGAIQRLPCLDRQQHLTRASRGLPAPHRRARRPAMTLYRVTQRSKRSSVANWRAGSYLTATFQNPGTSPPCPNDTRTSGRVRGRTRDAVHGDRGQQPPLERLPLRWGLDFPDLHGPPRHLGQALRLAIPGRRQRQGTNRTDRVASRAGCAPRRGTCKRSCATSGGLPRWPTHRARRTDTAVPRRAINSSTPADAGPPAGRRHRLPVADAHKAGLGTLGVRARHGFETGRHFWRSFWLMGSCCGGHAGQHHQGRGPRPVGPTSQGDAGGKRQRAVDEQPLTADAPRTPTLGGRMRRPVDVGHLQPPGLRGHGQTARSPRSGCAKRVAARWRRSQRSDRRR